MVLMPSMPKDWSQRLRRMRVFALLLVLNTGGMLYFCIHDPLLIMLYGPLFVGGVYLTYIEWFVLQHEWPGRRLRKMLID